MSESQISIACCILRDIFGEKMIVLCKSLIEIGTQTFEELYSSTRIPKKNLKEYLMVAILHNIVYFNEEKIKDSTIVTYSINIDNILIKLRYPRFCLYVKEELGDISEFILSYILKSGKITVKMLLDYTENLADKSSILDAFKKLKDRNLITYDKTEKSMLIETSIEDDPHFWYANYETFNKKFREAKCIEYIAEKFDLTAARIIKAMFRISDFAKVVSEDRLFNTLTSEDMIDSSDITREKLKFYLDILTKDNAPFLKRITQPFGFSINISYFVDQLRQRLIESTIKEKYGDDSLRIFRLLSMKKMLEQKQISEMAMIPIKETRDSLYSMFRNNHIILQEVPRTSEHNANRTFFLWSVDWDRTTRTIIEEVYKIMRNMKLKIDSILGKHQELIERYEEEKRLIEYNANIELLTDVERKAVKELDTMINHLENSLLHLDETLMILKYFELPAD